LLTWLACLLALGASVGSVYLSMGMGLKACPFCFYQRTFVFAVFGVLLVGLLTGAQRSGLSLLAIPLAVGGLGVAGFHAFLELTGKLECPKGLFDIGSAPQQSLAAIALLTVVLFLAVISEGAEQRTLLPALIGTTLLGAVFAVAGILSSPKPKDPTAPYTEPLDICRIPFKER
jgi:disulfide bond formation protein DsbB